MVRLGILAVAFILACGPALAEMRALVVGVDNYASMQRLRGAANDAGDLAATLGKVGVDDVTMLIDADATRAGFDHAWNAMVDRSDAGDVLFLSFSGHGIRVPEREVRTTPDGYEKGFLLQPYSAQDNPDEILRDEELYDRFALATERGLKIFFVADACHAGAAVRGADIRGGSGFRFQRFNTGSISLLAAPEPDKPVTARPKNPDVTIFSATDERLTIQEVVVDDRYRGALSYAVARGLAAAGNPVDAGALRQYVSPLVRVLSSNRQIPQFIIPDDGLVLVAGGRTQEPEPLPGLPPSIGLSVVGAVSPPTFDGVTTAGEAAGLIWDAGRRQLIDANGDILVSDIASEEVQGAIDARRVIEVLRARIAGQPGEPGTTIRSATNPDAAAFFLKGDLVEIVLRPGGFDHATMVNVAANGTVQFVWPLAGLDPAGGALDATISFTAPVTAPFGGDYVITILSREPLDELHHALELLHNRIDPLAFYAALRKAAATTDLRVGINAIFSCETLRSNGQCDSMLES